MQTEHTAKRLLCDSPLFMLLVTAGARRQTRSPRRVDIDETPIIMFDDDGLTFAASTASSVRSLTEPR